MPNVLVTDSINYMAFSKVSENTDSRLARWHWISWIQVGSSQKMLDSKTGYCLSQWGAKRRARRWRHRLTAGFNVAKLYGG